MANPQLIFLSGERAGQKIALSDNQKKTFGRDESAEIVLPEKRISRRHATLTWNAKKNILLVEDLSSLNGTFVNGEQISKPTALMHKDRLQLGSFLFEVENPSSPPKGKVAPAVLEAEQRISEISQIDEETGGMLIAGKLGEIALSDLLQLLATTRKTGQLVVSQKKLGHVPPSKAEIAKKEVISIYLERGILIYCEWGPTIGEEAFLEALKSDDGFFALFPRNQFDFAPRMDMPVEVALLDGLRRLDEMRARQKEQSKEFVFDDTFEVNAEESLSSLNPDQLKIFQLIWKQQRLGAVWALSHLEKKVTNQLVRELMRMNYIRLK